MNYFFVNFFIEFFFVFSLKNILNGNIEQMQISKPLERQIQGFQFKIQQAIAIRDEEINRLSETLITYKSKIIEAKEEIERIEHEIELAKYTKESTYRCNQATYERKIAMKKAEHNELIQRIQNEQAEEIDEMQRQFSETLNDLENHEISSYSEQFELIEKKKTSNTNTLSEAKKLELTHNPQNGAKGSVNTIQIILFIVGISIFLTILTLSLIK